MAIPNYGAYAGANALALKSYQDSLAKLNQDRGTTIHDTGFASDIDPTTGVVSNLRVDQNNAFGQFQEANRMQARQGDQVQWAAQSRGLGTGGGLAAQGLTQARHGWAGQDAQMGRDLTNKLAGYQNQQNEAHGQYQGVLWNSQQRAAQDAIEQARWNASNYSSLPDPGSSDGDPGPGPSGGKKPFKFQYANPAAMAKWKPSTNQFTQRYLAAQKKKKKKKKGR